MLSRALCTLALVGVQPTASAQNSEQPPPQDPPAATAQQQPETTSPGPQEQQVPSLPPVVVTAFRSPQDPFELARSVIYLDQEHIFRRDEASVLDNLNRTIGIWIEKRTATTSDPIIRGLSGANILATIDGNPLTTFWGEGGFAGDDMYGKVEAESISRIEVIRGPASVQYGANALGGVINFITRAPRLEYPDAGIRVGGRVKTSYDTVNDGVMLRGDVEAALPHFRMRVGGTYRDLGDGEGGSGVGTLAPSGGEDLNFDLNSEFRIGSGDKTLFLSAQSVRRRDLARYYRPTQRNENDRHGIDFGYRSSAPTAGEGLVGRVYYQWKEDRRIFLGSGDLGVANWRTLSTDWTWRTDRWLDDHRLLFGATLRQDTGESPDDEQFTIHEPNGTITKAAPDQDWYNLGLFVQDDWDLLPWLSVSGGLRYDRFHYQSSPDSFYQPPVGNPELDRLDDWQHAFTGGLGLVVKPGERWRVFGSWSRGFRTFAPKFGITQHGFGVLVPNGLLDPIIADNFEVGVRHRSALLGTNLVGYYTNFDGFQNPIPSSFQGQDFYDYNGNGMFEPDERVYVTSGNGRSVLYGVEWDFRFEPYYLWDAIPEGVYLSGGFMWNYGRDLTNVEPLRHTHPARGLLEIGYDEPTEGLWYAVFRAGMVRHYTRIAGSRLMSDVGYRLDPQDSTSPLIRDDGLPGYTVFDLDLGARIGSHLRLGVNLENLTNKKYRSAHSRMDAFGFNAGFFLEATF